MGGGQNQTEEWRGSDWARDYFIGDNGRPNMTAAMFEKIYPYLEHGMPVYQGERVAPLSDQEQKAMSGAEGWILNNPLGGGFGHQFNTTMFGQGGWEPEYNPYEGDSPYLREMIAQSNADITDAYKRGTAAQTDSAAAMQGAFGGSQHGKSVAANERALGDSLARNTTGMLENQYNRSAQLREGSINRGLQAHDSERNRQLAMSGLVPQMYGAGIEGMESLMRLGGIGRQVSQQGLDAEQQAFWEQAAAPLGGVDAMMKWLQGLSGQGGSVSSTLPGMSGGGLLAGLGMLGASQYPWGS